MNVEERFSFITDPVLKWEIDQNFMFIISLIDSFSWFTSENQRFGYKKTIIILTASIVEAILLYTIKQLEFKHARCFWTKKTREKLIYKISANESIFTYKEKKVMYDPEDMTFNDSIIVLWEEEPLYFTRDICDKIHELRRLRNGVHIHSSISCDPEFIAMDFKRFFTYTKTAIDVCEWVLKKS